MEDKGKEITYGGIMRRFKEEFPKLEEQAEDYRNFGEYTIFVWMKGQPNLVVVYDPENDQCIVRRAREGEMYLG